MTMLIHEVVTFNSSFSFQCKTTLGGWGRALGSLYRLGLIFLHSAELNGIEKKKSLEKKWKKSLSSVKGCRCRLGA